MPDVRPAPSSFPHDPPITPALIKQHKLTQAEYAIAEKALGRPPTFTELGVFSVMWSEHCSYKSSRVHLRRLPTKGPRVIQGPGENAGVVDIGDGFAAVFKMESHNHPSFIEPYQGAATGVGGILRDVFTMGARPIANLNSLRFGRPDHPRTPELLRGVVSGIAGYGNSIGVPTVGGEVQFDARYDGNILVNAFTCGVAPKDGIFYGRASGIGNSILYIGARTGRDGIHGATMASDEFSKDGPSQRPTMQVGDPFMGKLLIEACLELFKMDVLEGIQDMGAAGLTSSSVEMGGRAENGVLLDLDCVPRRAKGMAPYEILLSESQERMLLVAKPGCEARVLEVCKKWQLDAAVIGTVTDSKRWVIKATPGYDPVVDNGTKPAPVIVCDIPIGVLTDGAPVYDRPRSGASGALPALALSDIPLPGDLGDEIVAMCGSPNLGSRRWIWEQYDHIVRGGTAVRPGSDAGVVRVPCETASSTVDKFLAFASDCNGRKVEQDPFEGAAMAVAEVCRNLVCSGAEPIGLTDCLNFGNPERPDVMETFARAIDGLAAGCKALNVPIVSGNVSLYNETDGRAILPTPTVAAVGLIQDETHIVTSWFKRPGDLVLLLSAGEPDHASSLVASEYLCRKLGKLCGALMKIDLEFESRLQGLVLALARKRFLQSAHDISDGGLAVALAECCTTGPSWQHDVGARADVRGGKSPVERVVSLFGEAPSQVVISIAPSDWTSVSALALAAGVPVFELGVTGGDSLSISFTEASTSAIIVPTKSLRAAREHCLDSIVGR